MSRKKSVIDAELQELYARVPEVNCKGLCHHTCTAIDVSARERQLIREAGVRLPEAGLMRALNQAVEGYRCPALVDRRCSVYEVRPMICRLGGVSEALPCHYGCEPEDGLMPPEEMIGLLIEAMAAGGHPGATAQWREEMLAALQDPHTRAQIADRATAHVRAVGNGPGPWVKVVMPDGDAR